MRACAVEPGPLRTDFLDGSSLHRAGSVIDDYADSSGASRTWADASNHAQAGNPVKAAQAVIAAVDGSSLPIRLPLGATTVHDIEAKLSATGDVLDTCRDVAQSIDDLPVTA
ncbi:hypothetical protein [Streptomyces sp. NPDC001970]